MNEWRGLEGRYRVEWSGLVATDQLRFEDDPAARIRLDEQDQRGIEATIERRRAAGQVVLQNEDGTLPLLYRLQSFAGSDDQLCLTLGRTDYGEYLFTNVEHPERRAVRGGEGMSDALAVCAALVSGDGQVLFGPRSKRIADSPTGSNSTCFHVLPSGHPEPPQGLFEGLLMELREEAGIRADEVSEAHLTGLVRALPSGKPELTFLLKTDLTLEQIRARSPKDAWEFESLEAFPWTSEGAQLWLQRHRDDAVAPGHAAVALAARATFGDMT